jgi:hypothetical protein
MSISQPTPTIKARQNNNFNVSVESDELMASPKFQLS